MIFNSAQEEELIDDFKAAVGDERLASFIEYEHRPSSLNDQELFVLFNFQQYQIADMDGGSKNKTLSERKETTQAIHQNMGQMVQFQLGELLNPLSDDEWRMWSDNTNDWLNSMYWFNAFLSKMTMAGTLSEHDADEMLLVSYFSGLYYDVGYFGYDLARKSLGDDYWEGSPWYAQLNMNMTHLDLNLREIFGKRGDLYWKDNFQYILKKLEILGCAIEKVQEKMTEVESGSKTIEEVNLPSFVIISKKFLIGAFRDAHGAELTLNVEDSFFDKSISQAIATQPTGELPEGITLAGFLGYIAMTTLEQALKVDNPVYQY